MPSALAAVISAGWRPSALRFRWALARPAQAQEASLRRILGLVRGSAQAGRIPGFSRIATARDFQRAVPLSSAEDYLPAIERQKRGTAAELTREPVLRFEITGGSSGPSKYVPYTRGLLGELNRALGPWLSDLFARHPRAASGPGYWSVSPLGATPRRTEGGTPVGATDDASYFPRWLQPLLRRVFAVPGGVAQLPDVESARYVTLRLLLEAPELAFVSVWNPSFLTLLFAALDGWAERLADDLRDGRCSVPTPLAGRDVEHERRWRAVVERLPFRTSSRRAAELRALARSGGVLPVTSLWPSLALVSTWTDAQAARSLGPLRERLPGVPFQGKGLLSTEAVVSIPLEDAPAPVLAVRSPFLEFLSTETAGTTDTADAATGTPLLAHELEVGRTYEVVLSTAGGFLRYRIGDLVRVEGHYRRTPCVRFVGRADQVSDLVGEKLHAARVSAALAETVPTTGGGGKVRFAMLAPEWTSPPAYHLFVEGELGDRELADAAASLDRRLQENHHYRYAQQLGQLGPVRAIRVREAARLYEERLTASAQRAGVIKPADLHLTPGWLAHFTRGQGDGNGPARKEAPT